MIVLGLHGGVTVNQHEAGASLAVDGRIVASCEEERYTRIRATHGMLPRWSIKACLREAGLRFEDVDLIVTPGLTYDDFPARWRHYLRHVFGSCPRIERVHHQMAHVASAFYGSDMEEALCLSLDHSGDGASGMVALGSRNNGIKVIDEMSPKSSLGYFYTLMAYYLGFEDGEEYKVAALATKGEPTVDLSMIMKPEPGGWAFNWDAVRADPAPRSPFEPLYSSLVMDLLGQPNLLPGQPLSSFYRDVAASTQKIMEECLLSLVRGLRQRVPDCERLCLAGGMALNASANARLAESGLFESLVVPPFAGDRGLALGCAYLGAAMLDDTPRPIDDPYLGSGYASNVVRETLENAGCRFRAVDDPSAEAARLLASGKLVGWYTGRAEHSAWGLGHRAVLGGATRTLRDRLTDRVKLRDSYLPVGASCAREQAAEWVTFPAVTDGRYMTVSGRVTPGQTESMAALADSTGAIRIHAERGTMDDPFAVLLGEYARCSEVPVLMHASLNLPGQPLAETPRDAIVMAFA